MRRPLKKADRELVKLYKNLKWDLVQKELLQLPTRIEFRFNPAVAPHWGGVFERIVQSMKKALRATLGKRRASIEEFRTVLCNAEAIVNSRPLTTVSDDLRDPLPITPAHLVLGRALQQIPDDLGRDDLQDPLAVLWKARQRLHSEFWGRWRKEYLQSLQTFQKWLTPGKEPRVGEVVLIEEAPKSRVHWPLGIVRVVHPGRDGKVRMVTLWCRQALIRRDIRHIYRLEEAL